MDIKELSLQNPWWAKKEAINDDPKLKEFFNAPIKWKSRLIKYIHLDKDVVYSVRGPRQVGKTTLVKILIKELLEKGANPINIFYYACDLVRTPVILYDILESYYNWSRSLSSGRINIFLDEMSSVKEWQSALKRFIDQHGNANITFYLTSSHSIDIERSIERLPGRIGEKEAIQTHKVLLPMKFAEYVELRSPQLYEKVKALKLDDNAVRSKEFMALAEGKESASLKHLLPLAGDMDTILDEYLMTGGIMFVVNSFVSTKYIPQTMYELYVRQLMGDVSRIGRDEMTAKQIIASLVKRAGSRTSWLNIAKENGIPSPVTVPQYAHILKSMFLINIFHKIDESLMPKEASDKKIHISNPFMFHALRSWALNPAGDSFSASVEFLASAENKSKLAEGVVGNHLARAAFNLKPSDIYDVSGSIFYWMAKKGHELDFVLKHEGKAYGFDVCYQNSISSGDYIALRKFGKGCMISKSTFAASGRVITVPLSLFLLYV